MSESVDSKQPDDALREEIERRMRDFAWKPAGMVHDERHLTMKAAVSAAVEMVREEREKSWALEVNQEESDECTAELFALVCAVLDNKPEAGKARESLQLHVEHVRTCQKGSCNTELHGSRLRQRAEAAEKERDEAKQHAAACKRETARECAEWADAEARDCGCADRIKTRIVTAFGLTGEEER